MNSFIHFEEPNLACDIDQDNQAPYLLSDSLDAYLDNRVAEASRIIAEKGLGAIASKVIRDGGRHITRADYNDTKPLLSSINVEFPRIGSLQSRSLRRLLPVGRMLSHREFDFDSCSYRLGGYVGFLRDKGWTIVDHDEIAPTNDPVRRTAKFTRYELFAEFTEELAEHIKAFCKSVDEFEAKATAKHGNAKAA